MGKTAYRVCRIDGCDVKQRSKGLCNKHYKRYLRHSDPHAVKILRDDSVESLHMTEERQKIYIACETMDFVWDENNIQNVKEYWDNGYTVAEIAEKIEREPYEVLILIVDRMSQRRMSNAHFEQIRRPDCKRYRCEHDSYKGGFCETHYLKAKKQKAKNNYCKVDGCSNKAQKNHLCRTHFKEELRKKLKDF